MNRGQIAARLNMDEMAPWRVRVLDEVEAIVREAVEAERESKWQPIETAPKSGLFFGWSDDWHHQIVEGKVYWMSIAPDAKSYLPIEDCKALTMWTPLPAPPIRARGEKPI